MKNKPSKLLLGIFTIVVFIGIIILATNSGNSLMGSLTNIRGLQSLPKNSSGLILQNKIIPPINSTTSCVQDKTLNTLVFMDDNSYIATDAEIQDTFNYASQILYQRTCTKFNVLKIWHVKPQKSDDVYSILSSTLEANKSILNQAQYYVFFTDQISTAHFNGGVTWPINPSFLKIANDYCNTYANPNNSTGILYGAFVDWNHTYGGCGYDDSGSGNNHISDVSFDGQCRNQPGTQCVFNDKVKYYVCANTQLDDPNIQDPFYQRASAIEHELMHQFGTNVDGATDHTVESQACVDKFNSMNYKFNFQCPPNTDLTTCFSSICQYAWVNFARSKNLCSN